MHAARKKDIQGNFYRQIRGLWRSMDKELHPEHEPEAIRWAFQGHCHRRKPVMSTIEI